MNLWRPSFLVFFAVTSEGLLTEPQEGSVAGGTWITVTLDDSASHELEHLSPASWPHLEVSLVNADLPTLPCDVSPVYFDLSIVRCRTRSSPQEGLYYVEVSFKGRVINNLTRVEKENYAFKFSALQTPVVYQISPPSGIPGNLIEIYGKTIAGRYETLDFNVDYIDGPAVLVAEGDGWTSLCSFADGQAGNIYSIQTKEGLGTMQCRVEGNHIGSHNVSFSVFNKGKSVIDKDAWLMSAKQELFLYQTHSEIASVFPAAGSLAGGTDLTITGDFFEQPVQVTAAGVPCKVKRVSPRQIICTTEAVGRNRMLGAPQPGNRGLLFEVWDDASDLTEAGPGYRWQFVPSAQSPVRFLSAAKQSFSSRLRGFFVAPQTNNYTFWIQADGPASLYLSPSQDPQHKVRIAALPAGNLEWSGKWVKNWSESWQPKSQKFELTAGLRYYLEALHHGKAPSNGMRVGVQIHNTWLNPQVVNNYYIERHEIRARALYLPDVQMLTVSGTGWFSISWSNAPRRMIHTNSTAHQVQAAIEELLSVGCDIEPTSAKILFRDGFEKQGTENSVTTERVVYGTEPFCGRFSARSPSQLVKASPSSLQRYDLTEYTHVCFAHKGHMSNVLHISVSYTNLSLSSVERNLTCQWDFDGSDPTSWTFSCTDLWTGCVSRSVPLQDLLINTPVLVHQIDLLSIQQKETTGLFYLDEVIITDRAVTVSQRDPNPRRLGGRIIEAVTVVGSSPTYNVSWLVSGCGASLPLLSLRGAVLCECSEEDGHLYVSTEDVRVSVTIQRLQVSSPPLGGTFCIRLGSTVISDVSVHISSHQLCRLLQTNTDSSTAPYFNTSDFIVTKDSETCYESIWTLTWRTKAGDLPNVINVSAENLSGLKPAISSRVVYDGGVFIGPIFGDMLATSNNKTQVVVVVNDVPANCSGSCSFQFSQEVTPLVSDVEYSADDGFQATVVIRGVGFSEEKTTLQVQVKNTTCYIVMSDQTRVVCVMERLPLGVHQLTLLVRPYGFALNASTGEGIFLRVEPRLVAIEPPRASEIGGLRVALRGTGLEGVDLVLFGSQPCPILEDTRSSTQIECKVPSRGAEDAAVHVTLVSGYQSTAFTNLFQYDPSLNPAIVSLSRNRSGLAGGQELQIGISSFANYRGSDIKVQIGGVWAQIQVQMDSGLNVTLPALAVGWYNVSVIISGVAIASNRVEPLIHYVSEVFSIEPCCGSFLGGTLLTISGLGFSQNRSLVSVSVNEQTCLVTRLAEETIWCLTPPAANFSNEVSQDVPVRVNILISNSSFQNVPVAKSITFNYQRALTPLVTTVELEILESSLFLSIQGVNITGSVAKLGDSECELELQRGNESAMFYECSLPLSNLEPGIYPIQVIQRQLGYSHVTARLQTITVTPRITSIFPSDGSVCGGMLLTISGIALRSRRELGQVSLDGNYSCELQSSDNNTITCVVLSGTHFLPYQWWAEVSWALNVTVTVNGISSVCLGDCMLHLHEQSTPLVDAVTWETSGMYTNVTIRGQRLAWPGDSPVVHVNDQAVCKVTFWNETSIRCQMDCIAPGEYNISVSNRRSGQACFRNTSSALTITPQVHQFYPQNFSTNGGGLLTFAGAALKGKSRTSVLIGQQPCLILNVTCIAIQCTVPPGNGSRALRLTVDGISYDIGEISYSEESTPAFLSFVVTGLLLTINISQVMEMDAIHVFVGDSACRGVTITHSELQCSPPLLPAGEYPVVGLHVPKGWASSNLTFISQLMVTAVRCNWGGLNGGVVHLHGTGFSPGQTLVTICGSPCEMLDNATTTSLSCLAPRLQASLAFLCSLTHSSANCQEDRSTIIECDVQVMVGSYRQQGPGSYLYLCGQSQAQQLQGDTSPSQSHIAGLVASPKVERDEVLIYNSSCNITMETEAEMECEGANQPITAKITEIWKNWGQNTQPALQLCGRWAEASSWPAGRPPQDGANVTVEAGRTLLLGAATAVLHLLHLRGGKLVFTGPGPVELHAHYILISDGGELRVGSSTARFQHRARIYLYGSLHSPPLFPYGAKFLAVRNGTLSIHGWMPKVTFTYLKSSALANDLRLVLQKPVDWEPGDEIVVGRTGLGDAQQQEEVAVIESVNNTELYLRSPLRYSHNVGEERVNGQSLPLTAVVALLSRRVIVQGNVTKERISHVRECAEAGGTRGGSRCLYKRSERQLGSRDLGAVVIVEAFQGATSQLQVEGVQFYHMGQAFWQQRSALTVAGNAQMADSYIRGCCFLDSFGQGLHLTGISNLSVDSNVFFNISGHGLLLGSGLEKGNRIRNNIVIGLSATDGLSNIETLSPAGIYIRAPANHIEGNTVCAAGYGYFFHLSPEGPSKMPLLSFSENTAHSCTRHGLLVYPEYLPDSPNGPIQFDSFTVWSSQGGAQIFSSSNLKLQNFRIYACTDFGIDIIESLGNTAVANSVLVGHIGQKDNTCMSAGLKTPKRFQLFVSNTAFRNFDMSSCTAIRTCSGCYQGQGGFTVSLEHLTFTNSPFQVSFPFPHAAILEDLDGSVTGKEGSRILPYTDIPAASCTTSANFSQALGGSVCSKDLVFHRMSLYLREAPETPYNLTVIDSRNKTTTVNYVPDTLSDLHGWMCLLLDKETYTLTFDSPSVSKQLQYSVTFSNFTTGNYLLVEHKDLPAQPEVVVSCGKRTGQPLQSLPSYGHHRSCDWYLDSTLRKLTYLVTGADLIQLELKEKEGAPSPTSDPSDSVLKWSHPETWKDVEKGWGGFNCSIPGPGEDVIILPNRTILVDTDLPPLRGLYILGTLEFPTNSSNVLSAACIVVVGGTLNVGSFQHPLERDSKLLILLRASEGIYCDHLEEINVHPGSIGVYGKVQIYSSYPEKSWTHLGASVAPGNERIMVEDEVDWRPEGDLVISSSSYEAHQAELVTLKEVSGHSITLHERLIHRHIGHPHDIEDGRSIPLSAEVGLLTRNIQIKSDVPCTGKILVGHFTDSSGREFEGVLQLLNTEFLNFGPPQLSAIEFRNVTQRSSVMSSTIHGSCGVGIKAVKSNGICLHDNIVFNTVGPGIDLEGKNHSLIRNLVILSRQPEGLLNWVAGIKVNLVIGVSLYGNVVAGSERIGFHIRGQECLLDVDYCSENVAHSNLHGIHLYRGDGFQTCTRITGFLSYKNYDYGLMFHLGSSVIIDSVVLVDNTVGLMPVIHCLYAKQCYTGKRLLELRNSTIVATSSTFDCVRDRIKPQAADLTSRDRPPYCLQRGRAGMLWPKFTTVTSQRADSPWHRIVHCPKVLGLMKLKDVTFTGFTKSCHGEDRDVCIMSDTDHSGIMPLITSERSRMLRVNEKDKFYFHAASSEDTTFPEKSCEGSRKALVKDLDGNLLDLEPPVSVFPKSEFEWTRFYLQSGIYRDDSKCVFKPSVQGYFCKQADYAFVILENLDSSMVKQDLFPVVAVTGSFMDTFSDGASDASCRSAQHPSALFSVLPTTRLTTVCFPDLTPLIFRLYLLSGQNSTRLPLAIFYNEPLSLRVFTEGKYISPTLSSFSWNEGAGTNYFSFEDNLLYVLLHEEEPVQIVTGLSLHVAFTVTETTGEEGEANIMHQLADFLQVGHDQVRIVYRVPGGESMLEVISDNASKKKYHCPNMTFCTTFHSRSGSWGRGRAAVNARVVQSSDAAGPSKVLIFEFGDPPGHQINEFQRSLTIDSLKILASAIINAHQTGDLQTVLGLPVDTIMVNQPDLLFSGRDNRSRQHLGTCLYVRPYSISVHVQPSDGETEKQLPVQPQIVFLDKKGRRIDTLGPPSEPWVVSAHLKGSFEAVLKGLTEVQVIGGCASFSNLAVSSSGTNWNLVFTVTSPPGAKFTVLSQPFTIFPVPVEEKASLILVVLMSAIASAFVVTLVLCWFKKSKNNKTRTKRTDVPQASTKAPQKQAHPHAPHVQPCYDQRQNDNGVPVAREVEETGAVRHEVGQGKELSPQLCEATPVRKANALQRKTSNRDIFSSARKGGNHQQPCGGTAHGGSVELQQASVLGCSAQKDVPQPPDGCNEERGNLDAVYSPQEEVREQTAMGAAAEGYQKSCQAVEQ
ncbi:fibrocystin isoform X1 [Tympanuchus pallidicinctus]|uniref:fibrocystin isoform X1 n=1 Tax=Tympanuchus pallidicinctus TaxID=109042 RepID=UPI002287575E|nr:fibrocystin isoform X1 [Tympanuchus pallidicinctus]XP_052546717.1 fibrocystin isoform X1 [Tympanuchus pallidicinctus]XP_052546726.1 fibrocystin isoform X1 [Tympanuchus pallidicinctus]